MIARTLDLFGRLDAKDLELGHEQFFTRIVRESVGGEAKSDEGRVSKHRDK